MFTGRLVKGIMFTGGLVKGIMFTGGLVKVMFTGRLVKGIKFTGFIGRLVKGIFIVLVSDRWSRYHFLHKTDLTGPTAHQRRERKIRKLVFLLPK